MGSIGKGVFKLIFVIHSAQAVYLAPTKSLCSERVRDWKTRFGKIKCNILEMTGDAQVFTRQDVADARVIVATPVGPRI